MCKKKGSSGDVFSEAGFFGEDIDWGDDDVTMAEEDEDLVDGYFGLDSLVRTCQFVTLWWALWSLYDFYLTRYSPLPELTILSAAALYAWREDRKRDARPSSAPVASEASSKSRDVLPTPWPCTTEGCSAEDHVVASAERRV